jgi:putative ABC transport system ATP-binding protein
MVSIVAPHGSDAQTLVQLLAREDEVASGRVLLEGVPLPSIDLDAARAALVVAPHDAAIFAGPLRENFAPWSPSAAGLERIAEATAADEVVGALPEGWDSHVTERGRSLSGGQRQRIALARALAADPPVLVLHDPTTAVDSVTEARIAAGLAEARPDRTTIILTTSPALLAASDRVVLVLDGRVAAEGAHEELTRTSPEYREAIG